MIAGGTIPEAQMAAKVCLRLKGLPRKELRSTRLSRSLRPGGWRAGLSTEEGARGSEMGDESRREKPSTDLRATGKLLDQINSMEAESHDHL